MKQVAYINRMSSVHPAGANTQLPYLQAVDPDYKELIPNPALRRRMSRVVKMGVACGMDCIAGIPSENIHAIVTATGLGCLADTEKFMANLLDNNEELLNPTPFIQSTFNTVGAQIALLCRNQSYNVTYVHRGFSFESALIDGMLRLSEGDLNVLVGAFDELTDTSFTIQQRMGLFRGIRAGEGAQFFLLSKDPSEHTSAAIAMPFTFTNPASNEEVARHIETYLHANDLATSDIDCLVTGRNGATAPDAIYSYIENRLFPDAQYITFKHICGEYPTASAFGLWHTARMVGEGERNVKHALIYNCYNGVGYSLMLVNCP